MDLTKKSNLAKAKTGDVLRAIYNNEINENSLNDMPKKELQNFILEIFNKGILNDYLK